MIIKDLKVAVIGNHPVVRITTDQGIDGIAAAESSKPYLKPMIEFYKEFIIGKDPTDVERVMLGIRRLGAFKPWGAAVSVIEIALWDLAGKAANLPIYKLLGGKVRDKVQVYNGNIRFKLSHEEYLNASKVGDALSPEEYGKIMKKMIDLPHNFSIIKQGIAFHGPQAIQFPNFYYGEKVNIARHPNSGLITQEGFNYMMDCIDAMLDVCGDKVGLALDCGPGFTVPDAQRLAQAVEGKNIMWLEDMITGDYTPYVLADLYKQVTPFTTTRIHTGEQIYLRQNFVELIEKNAVNVLGPDVADVGGLGEMKFIAEYADLHGILFAPHGTLDGVLGIAANVHLAATLPKNYIAFELPNAEPEWWNDILTNTDKLKVTDSHIEVNDLPGLGVTFIEDEAKKYLKEEDKDFFEN